MLGLVIPRNGSKWARPGAPVFWVNLAERTIYFCFRGRGEKAEKADELRVFWTSFRRPARRATGLKCL